MKLKFRHKVNSIGFKKRWPFGNNAGITIGLVIEGEGTADEDCLKGRSNPEYQDREQVHTVGVGSLQVLLALLLDFKRS